jgi:hypothetical protein
MRSIGQVESEVSAVGFAGIETASRRMGSALMAWTTAHKAQLPPDEMKRVGQPQA